MKKIKRILFGVCALLISVTVAILTYSSFDRKVEATSTPPTDSTNVYYTYEVYSQDGWEKKNYFMDSILMYLECSDEYQNLQTEVTGRNQPADIGPISIDLSALQSAYWDDGINGLTDPDGTMSAKAYYGADLTELCGTNTIDVYLSYKKTGGTLNNTKWKPSEINFDPYSFNFDFSSFMYSSTPDVGDNVVLLVKGVSDVDVETVGWAMDFQPLGFSSIAGISDVNCGIGNYVATDGDEGINQYSGKASVIAASWAAQTGNSIAAGTTFPIGAYGFEMQSGVTNFEIKMYSGTACTFVNLVSGATPGTSGHFGEETLELTSSVPQIVIDSISFTATNTASSYLANLATTFAPGTTGNGGTYTLNVASDITQLDVSPSWTYAVNPVTVRVNGTAVATSGGTASLTTIPNSFTVTIGDGTSTTTYTFNVVKKNADATLSGLTITGGTSSTAATATFTPGTSSDPAFKGTYTTTDLKWRDKTFTIRPSFTASSGVSAKIGTTSIPSTANTSISFTSDPTAILADSFNIEVTAETGDVAKYTLVVNREAAYNDNEASNVVVTIGTTPITTFNATTQTLTLDTSSALFIQSGTDAGKLKYSSSNQTMKIAITKKDADRQTVTYTTETAIFSGTSPLSNTVTGVIKSETDTATSAAGRTFTLSLDRVGVSTNANATFDLTNTSSASIPYTNTSNVYTYKLKSTEFGSTYDFTISGYDALAKVYWSTNSTYSSTDEVTAAGAAAISVTGPMPTATTNSTMYLTVVPESGASDKKVYVIQATLISTDVTLASATISTETIASNDTTKVSGTTWTFANDVLYRSTGTSTFTLSIVGGKPAKQTYTIDGAAGTSKSITITNADATAGYKDVSVVVTSTDDSTVSETYTMHVPVRTADDTMTMTGAVSFTDAVTGVVTTYNLATDFTYSATNNRYTLNAGLTIPFVIHDVDVLLTPDKTTTTLSGSYGYSGTSVPFTDRASFSWHVENTTTTQTTPLLTYTVKTEANTTGVTGSLLVRVAAPQNGNTFTFDLLKSNGTVETKPTPNGSTYSYTLATADYVGSKFSIAAAVDATTSDKAKIYVTNSIASTADITGVNDANLLSNLPNSFDIGPTHTIYIVCRSESGSNNIVTINTATADQANNDIQNIELYNSTGTTLVPIAFAYNKTTPNPPTINVAFNVTKIRFDVTKEASEASLVDPSIITDKSLNIGTNTFEIQLKSATNVLGTKYTITIERADGNRDEYFDALQVSSIDMYTVNNTNVYDAYTKFSDHLDIRLNRAGSTSIQVDYTLSTGAKIVGYSSNISNNPTTQPMAIVNVNPGTKQQIYLDIQSEYNSVESPTTSRRVYITIFKANDTIAVTNVDILDQTGAKAKDTYGNNYVYSASAASPINFNVPFTTTSVEFDVQQGTYDYITATFNPAGTTHNLTAGNTKTITLNLKSEYAALGPTNIPTTQEANITYKIKRENAKTIDTLKEIKVTVMGGNSDGTDLVMTFTPDADGDGVDENAGPFAVANIVDTATSYKIEYDKADATETVNIASGATFTLSLSSAGTTSVQKDITIQSEDATRAAHSYRVDLSLQPIVYDSVNTLDDLVVTASVGTSTVTYLDNNIATTDKQQFLVTQYDYVVSNIRATTSSASISFDKTSNKSKVYYQIGTGTISPELTSNTISNIALTEGGNTKVTIIVKAEDTTVTDKKYTVTFARPVRDTDARVTKIFINGTEVSGFNLDSEGEYTVNVDNGTTTVELDYVLSSSVATIAANSAPVGGNTALAVGDNHLVLSVKAENDSYTKNYRVNVIRDAVSTVSDITITGTNPTDPTSPVIPIAITDPSDPTSLIPDPSNPTGEIPYDATEITISGTPAPGVTIEVTYPNPGYNPALPTNPTTNPQTITTTVTPNPTNPTAPVNVTIPVPEGTSGITITTIPQSGPGNGTTYTTTVTREQGKTGNFLVTYTKEDGNALTVTTTNAEYEYALDRSKTYFEPVLTISDGASLVFKGDTYTADATTGLINISSVLLNPGAKNEFEFVVTSQVGVSKTYKIIVYSADQNKEITSIDFYRILSDGTHNYQLADKDDATKVITYNSTTVVDSINVANVISSAWLKIAKPSRYSKVKVNNVDYAEGSQLLAVGDNTFDIEVISEYGVLNPAVAATQTTTVTVTINRGQPDSDATVKKLAIQVGGQTYEWDATQDDGDITSGGNHSYEFIKEDIGNTAASLTIICEPNSNLSTVSGQTGTQTLQQVSVTGGSPTGYIFTYTVQVTSESGNVNTYVIKVSRGPLDLNGDNSITNITVRDSDGNQYIGSALYNENTTRYEVEIPFILGATKYDIIAEKLAVSNATVTVTNAEKKDGSFVKTISYPTTGDMVTTHIVYATSHDGAKGTEYTVVVTVKAPSREARLSAINYKGYPIATFDPDTLIYTMDTEANSVPSVSLQAVLMDPLATISASSQFDDTIKDLTLNEGNNTFTITVVAQDGKTSKTYQVRVTKDQPLPILTDLTVDGYPLLDAQQKALAFRSDVTEYYAIIPNSVYSGTITATAESERYTVSCSGKVSTVGTKARIFSVSFNNTQTNTEANEGGTYDFNISLTAPTGKTNLYKIHVQRRSKDESNTNLTGISLLGRETKTEFLPSTEFNNNLSEYSITIPNKVRNLDVNAVTEKVNGHSATVAVYNSENLTVGKNEVILFITAEDGTTRAVLVHVEREENAFDMEVAEISQVKQDFADSKLGSYTVPSTVGKLNITVTNHDKSDIGKVEYVVSNGGILQPGENDVNVIITAADGTTTVETLKVTRTKMKFDVDLQATSFTTTKVANTDYKYAIDLGVDKDVSAIQDYKKYIVWDTKTDDLNVEVLTDLTDKNTNEVILKVSTKDGVESQLVSFQINKTTNNSIFNFANTSNIILWVIIGISIILLIIILISVNREKYGKVNKNRKK